MFINKEKLVLASGSPRRKEYFAKAGIQCTVVAATIDESRQLGESISDYVDRMASEKVAQVANRFPESWVVGADTVVSYGDLLCDKPVSTDQAVLQLMKLSGKTHEVRTGYAIWNMAANIQETQTVMTTVTFWPFPESVARAYVARGESFDKAGGYGIQDAGGLLVTAINGSYSNVVGFPMCRILQTLLQYQVIGVASGH